MVPGGSDTTEGAEHDQHFKDRDTALGAHRRANKGKERNQQQGITLQDAQWAWRFTQHYLHIERATDQRQADNPQQHQKAPLTR